MRHNGDKWTELRYTGLAAAAAGLNYNSDKPKGVTNQFRELRQKTLVRNVCRSASNPASTSDVPRVFTLI